MEADAVFGQLNPGTGLRFTRTQKRQLKNNVMMTLTFLCAVVAIIPLVSIFLDVLIRGVSSINLDFFIHLPKPVGETGGGMGNAILGTLILLGLSCLWSIPVGIAGGLYLAEFERRRSADVIRFTADVLSGVPSIVVGIFAYALFVAPMKTFSALSGAFALGFMMLPIVIRTTEEMVRLVPRTLREAAMALGVSRFRTTVSIVLKTALPGITTGILLAVARIAGETAPLLFTAFGNRFWSHGLTEPIAALPLQIFVYAISPFEDWHRQAWAGALVLIFTIFLMTLVSRLVTRSKFKRL